MTLFLFYYLNFRKIFLIFKILKLNNLKIKVASILIYNKLKLYLNNKYINL